VPTCIDPTSSPTNCGANSTGNCSAAPGSPFPAHPTYGDTNFQGYNCVNEFGQGYACTSGQCALTCQSTLAKCGTPPTCIDPNTDPVHCGAKTAGSCTDDSVDAPAAPTNTASPNYGGQNCTTAPGYACQGGSCTLTCQAGLVKCSGTCINPATDETFCGAAGACSSPNTGGDPPNAPVFADPTNAAGQACGNTAGYVCNGGTCALTCQGSLKKCGNACVNEMTDPNNCGGCGNHCNSGVCSAGACVPVTYTLDVNHLTFPGGEFDCSGIGDKYNGCTAGAFGVMWTDNGASSVAPTSIQVTFNHGLQCDPSRTAASVSLNATAAGTYDLPPDNCGCTVTGVSEAININSPTSYGIGALNTVLLTPGTAACEGFNPISGGTYATVVVTFSPE
jgi:hypothetical protein